MTALQNSPVMPETDELVQYEPARYDQDQMIEMARYDQDQMIELGVLETLDEYQERFPQGTIGAEQPDPRGTGARFLSGLRRGLVGSATGEIFAPPSVKMAVHEERPAEGVAATAGEIAGGLIPAMAPLLGIAEIAGIASREASRTLKETGSVPAAIGSGVLNAAATFGIIKAGSKASSVALEKIGQAVVRRDAAAAAQALGAIGAGAAGTIGTLEAERLIDLGQRALWSAETFEENFERFRHEAPDIALEGLISFGVLGGLTGAQQGLRSFRTRLADAKTVKKKQLVLDGALEFVRQHHKAMAESQPATIPTDIAEYRTRNVKNVVTESGISEFVARDPILAAQMAAKESLSREDMVRVIDPRGTLPPQATMTKQTQRRAAKRLIDSELAKREARGQLPPPETTTEPRPLLESKVPASETTATPARTETVWPVTEQTLPGSILHHFTSAESAEALNRGEPFDPTRTPIQTTAGGKRAFKDEGFTYLSLNDKQWGKKSVVDETVPLVPIEAGEKTGKRDQLEYDYKNQRWMVRKNALRREQLVPVRVQISPDARVLVISSPSDIKSKLGGVSSLEGLKEQGIDAVAIINTEKWATEHPFFREATHDQVVVLNPNAVRVIRPVTIETPARALPAPQTEVRAEPQAETPAAPVTKQPKRHLAPDEITPESAASFFDEVTPEQIRDFKMRMASARAKALTPEQAETPAAAENALNRRKEALARKQAKAPEETPAPPTPPAEPRPLPPEPRPGEERLGDDIAQELFKKPAAALTPEQKLAASQESARRGISILGPMVAEKISWISNGVDSLFITPMYRRLSKIGGHSGRIASDLLWKIVSDSKAIEGSVSHLRNNVLRRARNRPDGSFKLQRVEVPRGRRFGRAVIDDVIEGRAPAPPGTEFIVRGLRALIDMLGWHYESAGLIQHRGGIPQVFTRIPGGQVFPHIPAPAFYRILKAGKGEGWENMIDGFHYYNPGIPRSEIQRIFREMREDFIRDDAPRGTERRIPAEIGRFFRTRPTHVMENGVLEPIYETHPATFATRLTQLAANRLALIRHMGQSGITHEEAVAFGVMPSIRQDLVNAYRTENATTKPLIDAIRAASGIPVEIPVSTPVMRGIQNVLHVSRATLLTAAAPLNLFEPLGTLQAAGSIGDHARALSRFTKGWAEFHTAMERMGAINSDIFTTEINRDHPITGFVRQATRVVDRLAGNKYLNEATELYAANLAYVQMAQMQAGKGTSLHVLNAMEMGFSTAQARRMAGGRGTADEYQRYLTTAASHWTGGNKRPLDRTRAQHNNVYRFVIAFDTYATTKLNITLRQIGTFGKSLDIARRTGNWDLAYTAATRLMRAQVGTALGTTLGYFLLSSIFGGLEGLKQKWAELEDRPGKAIAEAWMLGTFAGPFYMLLNAAKRTSEGEHPFVSTLRGTLPGFMLGELWLALDARGPYKDRDKSEIATSLMRRLTPGSKMFANGLAAWAVGDQKERDRIALDTAERGYWRWRQTTYPVPTGYGSPGALTQEKKEFRKTMRKAWNALKDGDHREAMRLTNEAIGYGDDNSARASILSRRVLNDLTLPQMRELKSRIGPDSFRRLADHDELMENWALIYGGSQGTEGKVRAIGRGIIASEPTRKKAP